MIPRAVLSGGAAGGPADVLATAGATRAMTTVLGIMLFLTVVAGALGLAALGAAERLDRRLADRVTVQLVDGNPQARDRAAAAALAALRAQPGVARAEPVPEAELRRLLRPWVGSDASGDALPIPAMIDADLAEGASLDAVRAAVLSAAPGARVDAQAAWMAPVARVMDMSVALAALMMALTAAATLAVVALSVRGGLDAHRATIEVMHMLGSTDHQVARLFQRRAGGDALLGGGIGGAAGLVVAWAAGRQLGETGSKLLGEAALSAGDWLVLACLPPLFAGLAALAARRAVLADLRRTL